MAQTLIEQKTTSFAESGLGVIIADLQKLTHVKCPGGTPADIFAKKQLDLLDSVLSDVINIAKVLEQRKDNIGLIDMGVVAANYARLDSKESKFFSPFGIFTRKTCDDWEKTETLRKIIKKCVEIPSESSTPFSSLLTAKLIEYCQDDIEDRDYPDVTIILKTLIQQIEKMIFLASKDINTTDKAAINIENLANSLHSQFYYSPISKLEIKITHPAVFEIVKTLLIILNSLPKEKSGIPHLLSFVNHAFTSLNVGVFQLEPCLELPFNYNLLIFNKEPEILALNRKYIDFIANLDIKLTPLYQSISNYFGDYAETEHVKAQISQYESLLANTSLDFLSSNAMDQIPDMIKQIVTKENEVKKQIDIVINSPNIIFDKKGSAHIAVDCYKKFLEQLENKKLGFELNITESNNKDLKDTEISLKTGKELNQKNIMNDFISQKRIHSDISKIKKESQVISTFESVNTQRKNNLELADKLEKKSEELHKKLIAFEQTTLETQADALSELQRQLDDCVTDFQQPSFGLTDDLRICEEQNTAFQKQLNTLNNIAETLSNIRENLGSMEHQEAYSEEQAIKDSAIANNKKLEELKTKCAEKTNRTNESKNFVTHKKTELTQYIERIQALSKLSDVDDLNVKIQYTKTLLEEGQKNLAKQQRTLNNTNSEQRKSTGDIDTADSITTQLEKEKKKNEVNLQDSRQRILNKMKKYKEILDQVSTLFKTLTNRLPANPHKKISTNIQLELPDSNEIAHLKNSSDTLKKQSQLNIDRINRDRNFAEAVVSLISKNDSNTYENINTLRIEKNIDDNTFCILIGIDLNAWNNIGQMDDGKRNELVKIINSLDKNLKTLVAKINEIRENIGNLLKKIENLEEIQKEIGTDLKAINDTPIGTYNKNATNLERKTAAFKKQSLYSEKLKQQNKDADFDHKIKKLEESIQTQQQDITANTLILEIMEKIIQLFEKNSCFYKKIDDITTCININDTISALAKSSQDFRYHLDVIKEYNSEIFKSLIDNQLTKALEASDNQLQQSVINHYKNSLEKILQVPHELEGFYHLLGNCFSDSWKKGEHEALISYLETIIIIIETNNQFLETVSVHDWQIELDTINKQLGNIPQLDDMAKLILQKETLFMKQCIIYNKQLSDINYIIIPGNELEIIPALDKILADLNKTTKELDDNNQLPAIKKKFSENFIAAKNNFIEKRNQAVKAIYDNLNKEHFVLTTSNYSDQILEINNKQKLLENNYKLAVEFISPEKKIELEAKFKQQYTTAVETLFTTIQSGFSSRIIETYIRLECEESIRHLQSAIENIIPGIELLIKNIDFVDSSIINFDQLNDLKNKINNDISKKDSMLKNVTRREEMSIEFISYLDKHFSSSETKSDEHDAKIPNFKAKDLKARLEEYMKTGNKEGVENYINNWKKKYPLSSTLNGLFNRILIGIDNPNYFVKEDSDSKPVDSIIDYNNPNINGLQNNQVSSKIKNLYKELISMQHYAQCSSYGTDKITANLALELSKRLNNFISDNEPNINSGKLDAAALQTFQKIFSIHLHTRDAEINTNRGFFAEFFKTETTRSVHLRKVEAALHNLITEEPESSLLNCFK